MFSKQKAILYLHKNGISFYVDKESAGLQFEYGDTVKGLEVKNTEELQTAFASFLKENFPTPLKAILLLSEEIVLEKSILTKDQDEQRVEVQKFLDDVPFPNVSRLMYKMSGILQVIATNRDLYEAVTAVLLKYDWEVEAVVPIRIFGQFDTNNILSEENISDILKKPNLLKEGNLLEDSEIISQPEEKPSAHKDYKFEESSKEPEKTEEPEEHKYRGSSDTNPFAPAQSTMYDTKKSSFPWKSIIFGILIALIFFGAGIAILQTKVWQQVPQLAALNPTPTPAPTATPTPTPTPVPLAKDKLQIQVLNGTGKVGQAGIVKSALEKDGYTNVTTDNASSTDNTDTTLAFSDNVSQKDRDAIKKDLSDLFQTVKESSDKPSGSNNIVITTGTQK